MNDPNIFPLIFPLSIELDKLKGIIILFFNLTFCSSEKLEFNDNTYVLFLSKLEGSILKTGTAQELAADEQVRRVYLGQNFKLRKS